VRAAAARSLGKVGDASALEPLKAATSDREEIVASEAERALKKLSKKDLKPAPQPSADSGGMSGSGLASKRNPKEVEKLQAKLQQPVVRCIVKHAQRDEEFTGVTVRFTIRPDGRAGTLQLPELTEPAPKLEACLTKLLDKVALEPAAGGNMIVSWPMMLSP